jgi:D-glycero-D-manno-heptose 1,7-bisphosphate phosphatase
MRPEPGCFLPIKPDCTSGLGRKALFLDRDGVINVNHGYVHTPEETEWISPVFDLCRAAQSAGYVLVVVTNQAGIARGYYSEREFLDYTKWVHQQFELRGIRLEATYYCPHHAEAGIGQYRVKCNCRKPRPGMILQAAKDLCLDLGQSVLVGDMETDLAAAVAAQVGSHFLVDRAWPELIRLFEVADR